MFRTRILPFLLITLVLPLLYLGFRDPSIPELSWEFQADPEDSGKRRGLHKGEGAGWRKMEVPAFWEEAGYPSYDGIGWYRTEFELPVGGSERWALLFEGVSETAFVYQNGERLDVHDGWKESFAVHLKKQEGKHTVVIKVIDHGGQGGIWQPVTLIDLEKKEDLWITPYSDKIADTPPFFRDEIFYEVFVRNHGPRGRLEELTKDLDRLKALGITTLWLMPIHPIGEVKRKGSHGSPYSITDYRRVHQDLGSMDDLITLVRASHDRGMKVILDWVANHTAWDHPWVTEHPDWYTRGKKGELRSPTRGWTDVVDLNYDSPALRDAMLENILFWVKEAGVDGFRLDVAGRIPLDFWSRARERLDDLDGNAIMLAEADRPEFHVNGFDLTYDNGLRERLKKVFDGRPASILDQYLEKQGTAFPRGALQLRFTENHDIERAVSYYGRRESLIAFGLVATLPGVPLLYAGQEIGASEMIISWGKDPIDWTHRDSGVESYIARCIGLRRQVEDLRRGEFMVLSNSAPDQILSFRRGQTVVALNFSSDVVEFELLGEQRTLAAYGLLIETPDKETTLLIPDQS